MAPAAQGVICGFGPKGYELAIEAMADLLSRQQAGAVGPQGRGKKEQRDWTQRMAKDMKGKGGVEQGLIRELAELLEETGLSEIEIEREGMRVRVARQMTVQAMPLRRPRRRRDRRRAAARPRPRRQRPARIRPSIPAPCKSPMVGTAYLAPEPGAAPFVEVGTRRPGPDAS